MPNSQHHYYLGILPPPQLTIAQRAEKEATNQKEREQCSSRFRMPTTEPAPRLVRCPLTPTLATSRGDCFYLLLIFLSSSVHSQHDQRQSLTLVRPSPLSCLSSD